MYLIYKKEKYISFFYYKKLKSCLSRFWYDELL